MRHSRTGLVDAARAAVALLAALSVVSGAPAPASAASAAQPSAAKVHRIEKVCAPTAQHLSCGALRQLDPDQPALTPAAAGVAPASVPSGYGPSDLRSAYNLTTTGDPSRTVAIVNAFDNPAAESDLATYRSTYGLPACTTANGCFRKVNQSGAPSPLPAADVSWAGEISLDLAMVSAICPGCHILLLEGDAATVQSLGTAVNTAVKMGAKFVSNSYGTPEPANAASYDSSYYDHPGVVITASSGDTGYGTHYPASGQGVTAVGGTSLTRAPGTARGWVETAWSGAGSGCSAAFPRPTTQAGLNTGCGNRAVTDVSAVADPQTGVAVYQSYTSSTMNPGWQVYGGTSVAAPVIAAVYALAGTPGSSDAPNTYPYAGPAGSLNDVTSGSNGTCAGTMCTAGPGWDGPTGLGTPNGLAAFTAAPPAPAPAPAPTPAPIPLPGTTPPRSGGSGVAPATMTDGAQVVSPDGRYLLSMQVDGNLVLYDVDGKAVWSSGTNVPHSRLTVQSDGNVVIYDPDNGFPLWASGTSGSGVVLRVQNDGNVVLYSSSGTALWDSAGFTGHTALRFVPKRTFVQLTSGQAVSSRNGSATLTMRPSGDLVATTSSGTVTWSSQTFSPGARLVSQSDGNLVMYSTDGRPVWHANLYSPGAVVALQDDGNTVAYDTARSAMWDTAGYTGHRAVTLAPERVVTRLTSGQSVPSWNGSFTLTMQAGGNLAVTRADGSQLWATGTTSAGSRLESQPDGNLVIYSPAGGALWHANVDSPGAVTVIQNDGNVVIYDASRHALWDSGGYTGHPAVRLG